MASARHFSDLARDFSSSRPSRSAGGLARWLSALTSPFGAKLMPSPILTGPSASTGSEDMIFMSGSGTTPGITMVGSSPGCQRSIFPAVPSELPKNSVEVLTEKLSRGTTASSVAGTSPERFGALAGLLSSDNDRSNCGSGGALSASCNSGSSGACPAFCSVLGSKDLGGKELGKATLLVPVAEKFGVAGSSGLASPVASAGAGGSIASRSPFNVRSTLGKSEA